MGYDDEHIQAGDSPDTLTVDRVVAAALLIVQQDGVAALSMRRVAGLLAVQPMSLYHYVATKQALLDAVVEFSVAQLCIPRSGSPRQRLQRLLADLFDLAVENPALQAALPVSLHNRHGLLATRVNPTIAELLADTRWETCHQAHIHQSLLGVVAALAGAPRSVAARDALPAILRALINADDTPNKAAAQFTSAAADSGTR